MIRVGELAAVFVSFFFVFFFCDDDIGVKLIGFWFTKKLKCVTKMKLLMHIEKRLAKRKVAYQEYFSIF